MIPRKRRKDLVSKGNQLRPGSLARRTVIGFDDETHEQIRAYAIKYGISFAEAVRRLVEIGLEDESIYNC